MASCTRSARDHLRDLLGSALVQVQVDLRIALAEGLHHRLAARSAPGYGWWQSPACRARPGSGPRRPPAGCRSRPAHLPRECPAPARPSGRHAREGAALTHEQLLEPQLLFQRLQCATDRRLGSAAAPRPRASPTSHGERWRSRTGADGNSLRVQSLRIITELLSTDAVYGRAVPTPQAIRVRALFAEAGGAMIYDSILGTIGRTPIVQHQSAGPAGHDDVREVRVLQSPVLGQGSPRDRDHRGRGARGALKPGQTVVEATSGNTGIALAMVCAAKGYPFVAVMVETLLDRAPQDHAHARREGDPHARRRTRSGHGAQGRGAREEARLVPRAASSRTRRIPPTTATPPVPKSSRTSSASGSTTS